MSKLCDSHLLRKAVYDTNKNLKKYIIFALIPWILLNIRHNTSSDSFVKNKSGISIFFLFQLLIKPYILILLFIFAMFMYSSFLLD